MTGTARAGAPSVGTPTPAPAEILAWIDPAPSDGDRLLPALAEMRGRARSAGDAELEAATRYVESVWSLGRDPTHAARTAAAAAAATEHDHPTVAAALRSVELRATGRDELGQVEGIAAVAARLAASDDAPAWRCRGWHHLAVVMEELGLRTLAVETSARIVTIASAIGDHRTAGAAAGAVRRLLVDEVLWTLLTGGAVDASVVTASPLVARAATTPSTDPWLDAAQRTVLGALLGGDELGAGDGVGLGTELEAVLGADRGDDAASEVRAGARVALAHGALRRGDLGRAATHVDALVDDGGAYAREHVEVVGWLRARVAAAVEPATTAPVLDHARLAWSTIATQRGAYEQAVRERIEARAALGTRDATSAPSDEPLRDPLTGLGDRRAFGRAALDPEAPATVLVVDVDRFDEVNETHGRPVGDRVLRRIGELLTTCSRGGDAVCRLDRDEFAIVAPAMPSHVAERRAATIVHAVQDEHWDALSPGLVVTVSVGGAHGPGERDRLYAAATDGLRAAKARGGCDWRLVTSRR